MEAEERGGAITLYQLETSQRGPQVTKALPLHPSSLIFKTAESLHDYRIDPFVLWGGTSERHLQHAQVQPLAVYTPPYK